LKGAAVLRFASELFPSFRGKAVEFRLATRFRFLPLRREQSFVFEPVQRGIQRALLHLQRVPGDLLNALCNGIAMNRANTGDFQDQQVERALRKAGRQVEVRHTWYFYI
jgi:hypothetical protein